MTGVVEVELIDPGLLDSTLECRPDTPAPEDSPATRARQRHQGVVDDLPHGHFSAPARLGGFEPEHAPAQVGTPERPIQIVEPLDTITFRGRFFGYRLDRQGQRYAILDTTEPELKAFRTDDAGLVAGREVRVRGRQVADGQRLVEIWRLVDVEHERQRGRER